MSDVLELNLGTTLGPMVVRRATIVEALSVPLSATVEIALAEDGGMASTLDGDVELELTRNGIRERVFALRVARARFAGVKSGMLVFSLELHAPLWFLRFTTNVRKFRDLTAKDIVSKVLGESGVDHKFELERNPSSRPVCIQYRETNLAFVSRLLEHEGIFHRQTDAGPLRCADRSSAAEPMNGGAPYTLILARGSLARGEMGIHRFGKGARVAPGAATVNDYNWKTPDTSLLRSATGSRDVDLEVYDYPVGYRQGAEGQTLAKLRLEALVAPKRFVRGEGNVTHFSAGEAFAFSHPSAVGFNGEYTLTHVTHKFALGDEGADAAEYRNVFEAIPRDVPFRPPLVTPRPVVEGVHTAMVRGPVGEEIHTDSFGRMKAQFHWDREAKGTDADSRWLRMTQEVSSSMVLARVGWEVKVGYIAGDPDRPIGVARCINGQMVPAYGQPHNQNVMTIKTETYPGKKGLNEIKIDDTAGAQRIDIHAERNLQSVVLNDQNETVGRDETHRVDLGLGRRVGRDQRVHVGNDEHQVVDCEERLTVTGSREKSVGKNEKVDVKASLAIDVTGSDTETVGATRISIVGGIKVPTLPDPHSLLPSLPNPKAELTGAIPSSPTALLGGGGAPSLPSPQALLPDPKSLIPSPASLTSALPKSPEDLLQGAITRSSKMLYSRTVGGVHVVIAGGNVGSRAGKLEGEIVGGLKLTVSATESILETVSGDLSRTVGGCVFEKAGKDVVRSSSDTDVSIGGNAIIKAGRSFDGHGDEILIEGLTGLVLQSGALKLALTPASVTIHGNGKLDAGNEIRVFGHPDDVTK